MARRVYKPDQKAALQILADIHSEHIAKKAVLRQEIAQAFENKMVDLELKKSRAMNVALSVGVAKTDIGRTIGTTNFETIKALLARTAGDVEVEDLIPKVTRFSLTDPITSEDQEGWWEYLLNVDMAGPDYEAWLPTMAKTHFRYDAADRHKGSFRIGPDGPSLRSVEKGDKSTMNKFDLAVTGWLATAGKAEAAAWLAENLHDTREQRVEEMEE